MKPGELETRHVPAERSNTGVPYDEIVYVQSGLR